MKVVLAIMLNIFCFACHPGGSSKTGETYTIKFDGDPTGLKKGEKNYLTFSYPAEQAKSEKFFLSGEPGALLVDEGNNRYYVLSSSDSMYILVTKMNPANPGSALILEKRYIYFK